MAKTSRREHTATWKRVGPLACHAPPGVQIPFSPHRTVMPQISGIPPASSSPYVSGVLRPGFERAAGLRQQRSPEPSLSWRPLRTLVEMPPYAAAAADAPNWTDKLEAWSTFGGAVFTAIAVIVAFLVWRHDHRVRREDKLEANAAQARLVLGSITSVVGSSEDGLQSVNYQVANNSAATIFDLTVTIHYGQSFFDTVDEYIGNAEPGTVVPKTLELGEQGVGQWPYGGSHREVRPSALAPSPLGISVTFTDSAGLRWGRRDHGGPSRYIGSHPRPTIRSLFVSHFRYSNTRRRIREGHDWLYMAIKTSLDRQVERSERRRKLREDRRQEDPKADAD